MQKITLFIGLNDRDTKTQKVSFNDAAEILGAYIAKKIGFGTVSKAAGIYTHEDGATVQEETVRAEFYTEDPAPVMAFAQWAKVQLNQESIAVEVSAPSVQFV